MTCYSICITSLYMFVIPIPTYGLLKNVIFFICLFENECVCQYLVNICKYLSICCQYLVSIGKTISIFVNIWYCVRTYLLYGTAWLLGLRSSLTLSISTYPSVYISMYVFLYLSTCLSTSIC